jgi:hypothetical protein
MRIMPVSHMCSLGSSTAATCNVKAGALQTLRSHIINFLKLRKGGLLCARKGVAAQKRRLKMTQCYNS